MPKGPWKSIMIPFEKEIISMWKARETQKEIQKFLHTNGVEVSQQSISLFLKVRRNKIDPHQMKLPPDSAQETYPPKIPEEPTPIVSAKIQTQENSEIEEYESKEMSELRKELKRQAHADPMKDIFIRKGDKR